jgi:hypothetical protein
LAVGASVLGGSARAEAPVSSRATSPVVAKSRPRPTLGIPGSPWRSRLSSQAYSVESRTNVSETRAPKTAHKNPSRVAKRQRTARPPQTLESQPYQPKPQRQDKDQAAAAILLVLQRQTGTALPRSRLRHANDARSFAECRRVIFHRRYPDPDSERRPTSSDKRATGHGGERAPRSVAYDLLERPFDERTAAEERREVRSSLRLLALYCR